MCAPTSAVPACQRVAAPIPAPTSRKRHRQRRLRSQRPRPAPMSAADTSASEAAPKSPRPNEARNFTANRLPLDAVRIGHIDGDLYDPRLAWAQHRGITTKGAVLVRPDRVIGWRQAAAVADAEAELAPAPGHILGRDIHTTSAAATVARQPHSLQTCS